MGRERRRAGRPCAANYPGRTRRRFEAQLLRWRWFYTVGALLWAGCAAFAYARGLDILLFVSVMGVIVYGPQSLYGWRLAHDPSRTAEAGPGTPDA